MSTENADSHKPTCMICNVIFTRKKGLQAHNYRKHRELIGKKKETKLEFKCPKCEKVFSKSRSLVYHNYHTHSLSPRVPSICNNCDLTFPDKMKLGHHKQMKHKYEEGEVVTCQLCDKQFKHKHYLNSHIKQNHKTAQIESKCEECGKIYKDQYKLRQHVYNMHKTFNYSCEICYEPFKYKNLLETHVGRKHLMLRNTPCDECPKMFFDKNDLKDHFVQVHKDEKPFACKECFATFKRSSGYHSHKNTHKTTKDFICPLCQKQFKNRMSVDRCLYVHKLEGQKFPCQQVLCDTVLKTPEGLRQHIKRNHSGINYTFECEICTKSFTTKNDLGRHIRKVHMNLDKPFQCNQCPRKCYTNAELERHMLIHSGNMFGCPFSECPSKSNTQYGINHHYKKKHGQIKHRRSVEDIEKDRNEQFACKLCGIQIKAGPSPNHRMKIHLQTHEKQVPIECPVQDCSSKIYFSNKGRESYNLPVEFYNHIENSHSMSVTSHLVQIDFQCNLCDTRIYVRSGSSVAQNASVWNDKLRKHLGSDHTCWFMTISIFC